MAETFLFDARSSKSERYEQALQYLRGLLSAESDSIANLSNTAALLKECLNHFWIGFYLVKGEELVLGPFQGPVACSRIAFGKGVCGTSWKEKKSIIVPDVNAFPGHIACSSYSKSEIVIPIFKNNDVVAILDIDSSDLNAFDETDRKYLEELSLVVAEYCF